MRDIRTIGIVGAGQMGSGIAQLFAMHGFEVAICDISRERCLEAIALIQRNLQKLKEKGKITSDAVESAMNRLRPFDTVNEMFVVDFVLEAATEDIGVKITILQALHHVVRGDVVLATNTSSLPITPLAAAAGRPEKVIGLHFMNPPFLIEGVEVIRGGNTSEETLLVVERLMRAVGKTIVDVDDKPGFLVNRVLFPMIHEAILVLSDGDQSSETIDVSLKLCCNLPIGPLALADMIGLDTVLSIFEVMYGEYGERYKPPKLLRELVEKKMFGRKSGAGFYIYDNKA